MKKSFLLTPILLLALVACGNQGGQGGNGSQGGGNEGTSQSGNHDGLTKETAFTVEELIAFMSGYTSGQISDKEYFVTGVLGDSSYNSTYKQYTAYFQNHMKADSKPVELYSAVLDSSITADYTASNAMAGATVVAKGYLELFTNNSGVTIYELPYLPATASPTGAKYNPTIVSITGGNPGSGSTGGDTSSSGGTSTSGSAAGNNASDTGTTPANAQTLTFDFSSGTISGISATSSTSPAASAVATVNGYQFNGVNVIAHAGPADSTQAAQYSTGYLGLCSKANSAVASFANATAIPGKIVKVDAKFATGTGISALAPLIIDFGTSSLGSTSNTGGKTGGSGVTVSAYATGECAYFSVSCVQGVSSTGKASWYNASLVSISVTYVA